jgi:hypothetical protein
MVDPLSLLPDAHAQQIKRYILAPMATTQLAMDRLYVKQAGYYLAYRMQLACKFVVLCLFFGSALPLTYLFGASYFAFAELIDRFNLLRNMGPPPRTSARLTFTIHSSVLPIGIILHVCMAVVFFVHISLGDGNGTGSAALDGVPRSASPSPPPPARPPLPLSPGSLIASNEWDLLSSDQLTAIWSTVVIAVSAACMLLAWIARTHNACRGCLPCCCRPKEKRKLKAKLPKAARRLAKALTHISSNPAHYAVNSAVTSYMSPLTAALLTRQTAKAPTSMGSPSRTVSPGSPSRTVSPASTSSGSPLVRASPEIAAWRSTTNITSA